MLRLRDFRQNVKGLSDLLPYAALIDEGIILQKDGSFLAAFEYLGVDTECITADELEVLVEKVNHSLKALGTGFCIHVDAIRSFKKAYPTEEQSFFPDKVTQLIDDERRKFFGSDVCFNTRNVISITYKPTAFVSEKDVIAKGLEFFKNTLNNFEDYWAKFFKIHRL